MKKFLFMIACVGLFLTPLSSASASPKENSDCTSVNKIVNAGKTRLICAEILNGTKWIKVISLPTKVTQIKLQATRYIKDLNNLDLSTLTDFLAKGALLQQSYDQKNKEWREAELSLNTLKVEKNTAENELKNLLASISQAESLLDQSQAALAERQQTFTSLLSQLNAMSSQYSSAYSAKTAYVTCQVLNDFGFRAGGCGYYNTYNDTIISRYNSLESQVNGAKASYESYYSTYSNNRQRYVSLLNSGTTLNSKIGELNLKLTQSQSIFSAMDAQLNVMAEQKEIFDVVLNRKDIYLNEQVNLAADIQQVLAGNSKVWSKRLSPLYHRYQVLQYDLKFMASLL